MYKLLIVFLLIGCGQHNHYIRERPIKVQACKVVNSIAVSNSNEYSIEPKDSIDGEQGADGIQGEPGLNGVDGKDGIQGEQGIQGEPGVDAQACVLTKLSNKRALLTCPDGSSVEFKIYN